LAPRVDAAAPALKTAPGSPKNASTSSPWAFSVTFSEALSPTLLATSSISLRTGLSTIPSKGTGDKALKRWVAAVVGSPDTPGWIIFAPPEKPGMWCGTMEPSPITAPARNASSFTLIGVPCSVSPMSTSRDVR